MARTQRAYRSRSAAAFVEAPGPSSDTGSSGMVRENGLRVYRTGNPLPSVFIDDVLRRSREDRALHVLGIRP